MYLATLVWPISMPSLKQLAMDPRRSPQRIGNAHLADQPSYFDATVGRPERDRDFQRQYSLNPRCRRWMLS
jgi:hypothetical protein